MPKPADHDMVFLDDAPKSDVASDRLGHVAFADRIAGILQNLSAPEGYVIGLHGPWGSGKTSVLNFIRSRLTSLGEAGSDVPTVVSFEPWIFSGHQDVTAAFMKVLAEKLPGGLEPRPKRWFKRALRGAASGSGDVIDALAKIGIIADHSGGAASAAAGGLAKKAIGAAAAKWLTEPSMQATYNQLVAALREQGKRYVVLVDDIDRLTGDEIRHLMRMVKTVGKLPNVVYLLSYDRFVVWNALSTIDPDPRAGAFAEKIVQQELDLPVPSRSALLSMLSGAVSFLDLDAQAADRRAQLVDAGIVRWIRQPRDVVRLANSLRFAWSALRGELDPDDLLCMEGLRLNDRPLFEWIRDNRETLIERSMPVSDESKAALLRGLSGIFGSGKARAAELLGLLFPHRAELFRDKAIGLRGESWHNVLTRRGIATQAGFDAYFSLHPGAATIPKSLVDEAIAGVDDERRLQVALDRALARLDERGDTLVGSYLEEIRSRIAAGVGPTRALLVALVFKGSAIVQAPWSGDMLSPRVQLHFLITDMLGRWSDADRYAALKAAFESEAPLAALASLWVDVARASGFLAAEGVTREAFVTRSQLDEFCDILMRRIEIERIAGTLNEQPTYYDIAHVWSFRNGINEPRSWLNDVASSGASRLARVALGLLGYSRTSKGRQFSVYSDPGQLYDVQGLFEAAKRYAEDPGIDDDERARILALRQGLERFNVAGKTRASVEDDAGS